MASLLKKFWSLKKKIWLLVIIVGTVILALLVIGLKNSQTKLTHEQEVWLHALEWCESSGVPTKINQKDRDGTPSYYSFQFKPETFKRYGIKYDLFSDDISDEEIMKRIDDYPLQKKIVIMMMDDPQINWRREFPDCVRRLGLPPA